MLANDSDKELSALSDKESAINGLKTVLQSSGLKDEAKCKVIRALLGGSIYADPEARTILGYAGFESWQKKIKPEKEEAIRADFIDLCSGAISAEEYMKKAKKY